MRQITPVPTSASARFFSELPMRQITGSKALKSYLDISELPMRQITEGLPRGMEGVNF